MQLIVSLEVDELVASVSLIRARIDTRERMAQRDNSSKCILVLTYQPKKQIFENITMQNKIERTLDLVY